MKGLKTSSNVLSGLKLPTPGRLFRLLKFENDLSLLSSLIGFLFC